MNQIFFRAKTTDHTQVLIKKDHVSAIEVIPGKGGLDPSIKLYVNGYSFKVLGTPDDFLQELGIKPEDLPQES